MLINCRDTVPPEIHRSGAGSSRTWNVTVRCRATDTIVISGRARRAHGPDGQPVLLAPGNTWVELVPNRTGSVTLG